MLISSRNRRLHDGIKENKYYIDLFEQLRDIHRDTGMCYNDQPKGIYNCLLGNYETLESLYSDRYYKYMLITLKNYPIKDISRFRVCWHYWIRNSDNRVYCRRGKNLYKF